MLGAILLFYSLFKILLFSGVPHVFMNGYSAFSGALDPEHICKYFDAVVKKRK